MQCIICFFLDENEDNDVIGDSKRVDNNGKKKKKVHWVENENLVSIFYFEMNEDERGN